jgi:spermidine synthase
MGVGAWLSRALEGQAPSRYVQAELVLALIGGLSVPALLLAVSVHLPLRPILYAVVFIVGALVGVELPLLVKMMQTPRHGGGAPDSTHEGTPPPPRFADLVARALAYDYVGALLASLLFPLVLVPRLGLVRTSVVAGAVNAVVAVSATLVIRVEHQRFVRAAGAMVLLVLAISFIRGESWVAAATD